MSLYGLKDVARLGSKLFFDNFHSCGLNELETAPYVFVKQGLLVVYYVDDLMAYTDTRNVAKGFRS